MKIWIVVLFIYTSQSNANIWAESAERAADAALLISEAGLLAENLSGGITDPTIQSAQQSLIELQNSVSDARNLSESAGELIQTDSSESSDLVSSLKRVNFKMQQIRNIKDLILRLTGTKTDVVVASQTMQINATLAEIHKELAIARKDRLEEKQERHQKFIRQQKLKKEEIEFFSDQEKLMRASSKKIAPGFDFAGFKFTDSKFVKKSRDL